MQLLVSLEKKNLKKIICALDVGRNAACEHTAKRLTMLQECIIQMTFMADILGTHILYFLANFDRKINEY